MNPRNPIPSCEDIAIAEMLELEPVRWGKPERYAHAGWMLLAVLTVTAILTVWGLCWAWDLAHKLIGGAA